MPAARSTHRPAPSVWRGKLAGRFSSKSKTGAGGGPRSSLSGSKSRWKLAVPITAGLKRIACRRSVVEGAGCQAANSTAPWTPAIVRNAFAARNPLRQGVPLRLCGHRHGSCSRASIVPDPAKRTNQSFPQTATHPLGNANWRRLDGTECARSVEADEAVSDPQRGHIRPEHRIARVCLRQPCATARGLSSWLSIHSAKCGHSRARVFLPLGHATARNRPSGLPLQVPEMVLAGGGRVHHAGDVTEPAMTNSTSPAEKAAAQEGRSGRARYGLA